MLLTIFIYAVIGTSLFGGIMLSEPLTAEKLNFHSVGNSFLTLFRMATGENWHELLHALGRGHSINYQCIENPTWEDYASAGH